MRPAVGQTGQEYTNNINDSLDNVEIPISQVDRLEERLQRIESSSIFNYSVRNDGTNSNPATSVTYTNDAVGMIAGGSGWDEKFPYNAAKICLFKNGAVNYYLNPNDVTKKIDGTASDITTGLDGDVMVEISKIGNPIATAGNNLDVGLTNAPSSNYLEIGRAHV